MNQHYSIIPLEIINLENISVCYKIPEEGYSSFKDFIIRFLQNKIRYKKFIALQAISLSVHKSETFGIIGVNGAGKSTLLKVISHVLVPSSGRVQVRGRVSPLLELGAGFHPELTGKENIYLNGTLLGHTRQEVDECLETIIEFANVDDFINAPLRTYSSGMVTRLGFAVATAWKPEILILDETLAVGDEAFKSKCIAKIDGFRLAGTTTLLVSHDLSLVQDRCDRVALLDKGMLQTIDTPDKVINLYKQHYLQYFND